ncbi:MAG TPA: response regulator [Opitutaceae bacterium]|nr:response regulator [Opitutaceae bacterium]
MNKTDPGSRGRLLVADDEAVVRNALSRMLQSFGYACTCVASGQETLDQLRQNEFDALISDLRMPGNDGVSMLERVSQLADGLPIVVLTGQPTVETAARALRLPVVGYLMKPPDFDELTHILDDAILKLRTRRAMQAGRRHLHDWEQELDSVLHRYRHAGPAADGSMSHYLQLSLRHVILVLSELEQAARALETSNHDTRAQQLLDREVALRRAVDVLRRTKQSFKSKELADLRKDLEQLLARNDAADPAEAGD